MYNFLDYIIRKENPMKNAYIPSAAELYVFFAADMIATSEGGSNSNDNEIGEWDDADNN